MWDGVKPGARTKQEAGEWKGALSDYIAGIRLCGTWCCYLELVALAHALKRDIYVLDFKGDVKVFSRSGAEKPSSCSTTPRLATSTLKVTPRPMMRLCFGQPLTLEVAFPEGVFVETRRQVLRASASQTLLRKRARCTS